jgi:CheY-like chemotaxis protein
VRYASGFEVSLAPDYRLALEDLESTRTIDLLISDIVMPERVNGIALSRMARIRRPELKAIYLTAYNIPGIESEARSCASRSRPTSSSPRLGALWRPADTGARSIAVVFSLLG